MIYIYISADPGRRKGERVREKDGRKGVPQQQPPVLQNHGVLLPGGAFFFYRISDDTLGSFFVWFWTLLVLQSHGVLLPGAAFFEAVLPASAAAAAATSSASSRRQQKFFF